MMSQNRVCNSLFMQFGRVIAILVTEVISAKNNFFLSTSGWIACKLAILGEKRENVSLFCQQNNYHYLPVLDLHWSGPRFCKKKQQECAASKLGL
jgi:hypothetical protein